MIAVPTTAIRGGMPRTRVIDLIHDHLLTDLPGARAALPGRGAASPLIGTWGTARVRGRAYTGVRIYHVTTPDLPERSEVTLVYRDDTGELVAWAQGCDLGEMRNGALGALAARRCAPGDRPLVVAVFGAGRQAFAQCEYVCSDRPPLELRVVCRRREQFDVLRDELRVRCGVEATYCPDGAEAVNSADVVITATSSPEPVLDPTWLAPGAHINHVGAKKGGASELPRGLIDRADVVIVDALPQFRADLERGEFTYPFHDRDVISLSDLLVDAADHRPTNSIFISNCLPGGEVAILATWAMEHAAPTGPPSKVGARSWL